MIFLENYDPSAAAADAARIFPGRTGFNPGDLEFAAYCRSIVKQGRAAVKEALSPLQFLQKKHDGQNWINTLELYLLDSDMSIQKTTDALSVHRNTVKYRIKCMSDKLGYPLGQMPASLSVYIAAGVDRLTRE